MFLSAGSFWGIWVLLIFFLGRIHAEPLDDVTILDSRRRAIGIFSLVLFFLVFVALPLTYVNP